MHPPYRPALSLTETAGAARVTVAGAAHVAAAGGTRRRHIGGRRQVTVVRLAHGPGTKSMVLFQVSLADLD